MHNKININIVYTFKKLTQPTMVGFLVYIYIYKLELKFVKYPPDIFF
jgi:hypothetical protein